MNFMKKLGLGLLGLLGLANSAFAAITFDDATQTFAGVFDLGPFYSAIGIIITAIAIVAAIGLAIKQFRRVG